MIMIHGKKIGATDRYKFVYKLIIHLPNGGFIGLWEIVVDKSLDET